MTRPHELTTEQLVERLEGLAEMENHRGGLYQAEVLREAVKRINAHEEIMMRLGPRQYTDEQMAQIKKATAERELPDVPAIPLNDTAPPEPEKSCKHDSTRRDGWLDDCCMICGKGGYWEDGHHLTENEIVERNAKRHPSGKTLIESLSLAEENALATGWDPAI